MAEIRRYTKNDAVQVGRLIADTYGEFNLREMSARRRALMLGPFALAGSQVSGHQEAIADAISAPSVWVAEQGAQIVGVIRGGRTDHSGRTVLMSLFVSGPHQGRGIGRALVERFESEYIALGASVIKVSATLFAVPFYSRLGYKKTTGVRSASSFGEPGLPYQPMARVLS
jgi:predicted N-acetyltransferase YhbS